MAKELGKPALDTLVGMVSGLLVTAFRVLLGALLIIGFLAAGSNLTGAETFFAAGVSGLAVFAAFAWAVGWLEPDEHQDADSADVSGLIQQVYLGKRFGAGAEERAAPQHSTARCSDGPSSPA